jgi:cellulose biosynthesis protein BcsQ
MPPKKRIRVGSESEVRSHSVSDADVDPSHPEDGPSSVGVSVGGSSGGSAPGPFASLALGGSLFTSAGAGAGAGAGGSSGAGAGAAAGAGAGAGSSLKKRAGMEFQPVSYVEPLLITVTGDKGGVGKTTSLYEIAHTFYEKGYRVLMVDADSQCSLTTRVFDLHTLVGLETQPGSLAYQKQEWSRRLREERKRTSISDVFHELLRNDPEVPPSLPNYDTIATEVTPIQVPHAKDDRFMLIPGSSRLKDVDDCLPSRAGQTFNGLSNLLESITHVLRKIAKEQGFDLVLIDISPGLTRWNRAMIMGSDYIYIPFMPTMFCYDTTQEFLRNLLREKETLEGLYNNNSVSRGVKQWSIREDRGPYGRFKLIAVFMQAGRGSKQSIEDVEVKLFEAYAEWQRRIYQSVQDLMPEMYRKKLVGEKFYYTNVWSKLTKDPGVVLNPGQLPEGVKDFCSAGLKAQALGVPLVTLKDRSPQKDQARRYFGIIAEMFEKNAGSRFPAPGACQKVKSVMERSHVPPNYQLWYNTELINRLIVSYGEDRVAIPGTDPENDLNAHAFYILGGAQLTLGNTADIDLDASPEMGDPLRDRIEYHRGSPLCSNTSLLLPINLNGQHFAIIMLRRQGLFGMPPIWTAEYFDSMGVDEETNPIVAKLRALGYAVTTNRARIHQEDGFTCGVWVVEAARYAMGRGHLPVHGHDADFQIPSIYARRYGHQGQLPGLFDEYLSGRKPLANIFASRARASVVDASESRVEPELE